MAKKTSHLGKESGKSSTKWFGGGEPKVGHGARTGDGKTSTPGLVKSIIFRKGK